MWFTCCKYDLSVTVPLNLTLPICSSVAMLCPSGLSQRQSDGNCTSNFVRFLIYRVYQYGNIFVLNPDLLKYRKKLFKIDFLFKKVMIRH